MKRKKSPRRVIKSVNGKGERGGHWPPYYFNMLYIQIGIFIEIMALIWLIIEYFGVFFDDPARKHIHSAGVFILWLMIVMVTLITLSEVI